MYPISLDTLIAVPFAPYKTVACFGHSTVAAGAGAPCGQINRRLVTIHIAPFMLVICPILKKAKGGDPTEGSPALLVVRKLPLCVGLGGPQSAQAAQQLAYPSNP